METSDFASARRKLEAAHVFLEQGGDEMTAFGAIYEAECDVFGADPATEADCRLLMSLGLQRLAQIEAIDHIEPYLVDIHQAMLKVGRFLR